ncbi:MAG TPA: hypothetical protein VEC57_11550 [Candidatus Limnocylindrales bacterium]|nr:hypothetical protein [Candidatus Limnocylindrales bacterium]
MATTTSTASESPMDFWGIVLGIFSLGNLGNAFWMLASPPNWYENLPAGVPDFGPLNEHFVRDIGAIYLMIAVALAVAAFSRRWRFIATASVTVYLALHALVHVLDTLRGLVGPEHWLIDMPGVYIPAILLAFITWKVADQPR